jgi:hypothetical protein
VAFFYAPAKTLLQRYTPIAAHGRILSINQSLEPLADMAFTPLAAVALIRGDVRLLGVGAGVLLAGIGVVALLASPSQPEVARRAEGAAAVRRSRPASR